MRGFSGDKGSEIVPIALEKYINQVQDGKRVISKEILECASS
jgi:hypothetical protein